MKRRGYLYMLHFFRIKRKPELVARALPSESTIIHYCFALTSFITSCIEMLGPWRAEGQNNFLIVAESSVRNTSPKPKLRASSSIT
jgi:hypothetical protein